MMTADMDVLPTAPVRVVREAGAPQRAGRHGSPSPAPRNAPTGGPAPAGRPAGSPTGRTAFEPKLVRRFVAAILIGAATMLGVATLDTFAGATVPVLGTFASLPAPEGSRGFMSEPPPSAPGTCLNWTRPDAADAEVVECSAPHLFEQAGSVALTDQTELPDDRQWRQLVNERCGEVVTAYLGGKYDPTGKFRIGALKPSPTKWADGDRELRCGLQSASRSGALFVMSGRAADTDQSRVQEPGTCLGIDGREIGDPADCAGPHAVETVGIVDLSSKFAEGFPQVSDQDGFLQQECSKIAGEYAGGPDVVASKKLTVYWDNLSEAAWKAGTRKVNCNLGALLPDRSGFAPVTGSVKGPVQVGENPAPPVQSTPGVPAPGNNPPGEEPDGEEPEQPPVTLPPVEPTKPPEPTPPPNTGEPPTSAPQTTTAAPAPTSGT
ncbi:septum formation family protein [Actinomycetes bacterium KLBMP 9759]